MGNHLRVRISMWPETLGIDVSRESFEKLEQYQALLLKWQKAINLVSPKTLQESGVRHFADSAQLQHYIPKGVHSIMDWGSGGGFPGAVLAILNPDVDFILVESDERKCQFLRTVSRETSATMRIENSRIENFVANLESVPDLITARALKPVSVLLDYARPLFERRPDLKILLLKGESAEREIKHARHSYNFDVELWPSVTNRSARIMLLSDIKLKA